MVCFDFDVYKPRMKNPAVSASRILVSSCGDTETAREDSGIQDRDSDEEIHRCEELLDAVILP